MVDSVPPQPKAPTDLPVPPFKPPGAPPPAPLPPPPRGIPSIAQPEPSDGLPIPQRYWGILTIALGLTMAVLDGAIANVALPTIARDVHASPSASIWVVNAYQLAVTIS